MSTINEDPIIHGSWNIRCDRQKFSIFWAIFCAFSPLTTWKIKILSFKKTPGYILILHICTINDKHMIYVSWDMECDRHNFYHYLLNSPKTQNSKKWKKCLEISSFYTCVLKIMIICYTVPYAIYMAHDRCNCYFSFWVIVFPFTPLTA